MSKIAEQKALEEYPEVKYKTLVMLEGGGLIEVDLNIQKRDGYIKGYDQAVKDIQEQAEKSVIEKSNGEVTIEDLVAYNQGFKTGRELTIQAFSKKSCEWLSEHLFTKVVEDSPSQHYTRSVESMGDFITQTEFIEQFKNYMQNESEN